MNSGGQVISENLVGFVDRSGQLYEGGDYVLGQDGDKVFKDEILSRFAKVSNDNLLTFTINHTIFKRCYRKSRRRHPA